GRAKRRRRFAWPPDGRQDAELTRDTSAESKAAWRFASHRFPPHSKTRARWPPCPEDPPGFGLRLTTVPLREGVRGGCIDPVSAFAGPDRMETEPLAIGRARHIP